MTVERKNEITNCLQLLLQEQSPKAKGNREIIFCALFFQYYFSVVYEEQAGEDFSFAVLFERVEKGRFQWKFYEKWMKNFSDFLYLVTGRQEAQELFNFVKPDTEKNEQRALERLLRKEIRSLFQINLKKDETEECLELFLNFYFKKEEDKDGIPKELSESIAAILLEEKEHKPGKTDLLLYGSGKGQVPVTLKRICPSIIIRVEEANEIWQSLACMIYFAVDLDHKWVFEPEEEKIELGISLWPFGTSAETDGNTFPSSCIPSQKEKYKNLGRWLLELSETGVFYSLCPAGFLYREGREKNLRRYLIEEMNLLDGLFLLPDVLWKPGFPETVLLCFRKGRTEESPVYLLDGSREEVSAMAELTDYFLHRKEKDNLACLLSKEQIKFQGMNLNPARYFETGSAENIGLTDMEAVKNRLLEIEARLDAIEERRKIYTLELDLLMPSD